MPLIALLSGIVALYGIQIWNWCRVDAGRGLLGNLRISEIDSVHFHFVMFWNLLAVSLGSFLMIAGGRDQARSISSPGLGNLITLKANFAVGASAFGWFLYVLGEGPNILERFRYLGANGSQTVYKATHALVPVFLTLLLYALIISVSKSELIFANSVLAIWLITLAVVGTRGSTLAVFVAIAGASYRFRKKIALVVGVQILGIYLYLLFFTLSQVARSNIHGLYRLKANLAISQENLLHDFGILPTTKRLFASFFQLVPVVAQSVNWPSKNLLISNLNPLIGVGSKVYTISSESYERLYPYVWVPLSTIGQVYGTFGGPLLFILVGSTTVICYRFCVSNPDTRAGWLLTLAVVGTWVVLSVIGLQYSSRVWFRGAWIVWIAPFVSIYVSGNAKKNLTPAISGTTVQIPASNN